MLDILPDSRLLFCANAQSTGQTRSIGQFYFQIVQKVHKDLPRLSGILKPQSGREHREVPRNLRFPLLNMPDRHSPAGAAAAAAHSGSIKKLFPVPCHGSRQRRRTDYQHPPDRPQLIRGSHTAGSTAFLLLSTVLPAFCCILYQKLARFDTMLLASFRAFLYNEKQEKPVPGTGTDAVC